MCSLVVAKNRHSRPGKDTTRMHILAQAFILQHQFVHPSHSYVPKVMPPTIRKHGWADQDPNVDLEEDDKDDPNAMDVDDAGDVEMAHSDGDGATVPVTSSTDVAVSSSGTIVPEVTLFKIEDMTRNQRTWFYEFVQAIMMMDYLFACNFTPVQNSLGDFSSIQYPFHWIILVYIRALRNIFEK